jgi:ATP-dependent DNA helicase RecG
MPDRSEPGPHAGLTASFGLDQLDLDALREGWDFEGKLAEGSDGRGTLPKSFWPTYSAMANSDGGLVILGARQLQDNSFEYRGLADPDRIERELWATLDNRNKVSVNLLSRGDVDRSTVSDKTLVWIRIPRAARSQRPVYIDGNPLSGTFIRVYEGDHRATEEQVRRMLADAEPSSAVDAEILVGHDVADLDPTSIAAYRSLLQSRRPDHPFLAQADHELLRSIGAVVQDRETGADALTVAGLLVLGREPAILERFPSFHLDYREVSGADTRWTDRLTPDGTWPGNLLEFHVRALPRLTSGLKVPFRLDPTLFRQDTTPVHEALREALTNSLVHAAHGYGAGTRILRFPDRFVFTNPGTLLLPRSQILAGGTSESRNPGVQRMFQLIGAGERAGSGVPTILQAWQQQHWRAPSLSEDRERSEVVLELRMLSLFPGDAIDELQRRFGAEFDRLDETSRIAVATAEVEGRVSNARLQDLTNTHSRDLTLLLKDLVSGGLLMPHEQRRGRYYTISAARLQHTGGALQHSDPSSQHSDPSSHRSDESPVDRVVKNRRAPRSEHKEASSEHSGPGSEHKGGSSEHSERPAPNVGRVAASRRASRSVVEAAVLELCSERDRTLPELAEALQRESDSLRVHYLTPLLKRGLLERRYPDQPNHPQQAYRTAKGSAS